MVLAHRYGDSSRTSLLLSASLPAASLALSEAKEEEDEIDSRRTQVCASFSYAVTPFYSLG
jgi:hypothetical protein